jgi:predicted  nucleic acid-binding Zn-ribbon protein
MDTITKLTVLKNKVEEAKANYERAKGRMEASDKALLDAGFENVAELEKSIAELSEQIAQEQEALEKGIADFAEKYGELLK